MINLSKKNILNAANDTGFIKDNVEKVISRLIMYICSISDDREQIFRIFKSSGQFNDNINFERCYSIIDDTLKTFLEYKTKETNTKKQ